MHTYFPGDLLFSGQGPAWQDLLVEIHVRPDQHEALLIPAVPEPQIVWTLEGQLVVEEREIGGTWLRSEVNAGDMFLTASRTPYEVRWQASGPTLPTVMAVYVGLPLLAEAAADLWGEGAEVPVLREFSAQRDEVLWMLLELLRQELVQREKASVSLVQGVARALAVHLMRAYGEVGRPRNRRLVGLTAFQLAHIDHFLKSRLDRSLHLEDLAREVGLSQFHFARLFKKTTGVTPSRHLTRMRMDRARRLLRKDDHSILEIGLEVGYQSASHFSDVFRKEVGVTPSDYRRNL
ncbi:MAG: helix-turn-helix transcriptional regulator [Candidatus Eremiobacteraeota bacterium]|nr:helix-turn-helix transcriptional regulator [Candidatus Eremiobacteraeota bacterium]